MRDELLKGLTEEQIKKVMDCKSPEEILALAKSEGIELSDDQLEAVSGGACSEKLKCPKCDSEEVLIQVGPVERRTFDPPYYMCKKCYHEW